MTKQEWDRCFGPAPAQFEACVQRALAAKQKENVKTKRVLPRTAIIAAALLLALMGMALAASSGIFDFLHTDNIGEIRVEQPKFTPGYTQMKLLESLTVEETVCDGISAHLLIRCTLRPEMGVLRMAVDRERLPAGKPVYYANMVTQYMSSGTSIASIWDSWNWHYNGDNELILDISFGLRELEPLGDTLILSTELDLFDAQDQEVESLPFTVEMPVQHAVRKEYTAVNMPIELENYRVNSARVVRTDMAGYLYLDVQDNYDQAEYDASFVRTPDGNEVSTLTLPLHGSYWTHLADTADNIYPTQFAELYLAEDCGDEWEHYTVMTAVPPLHVEEGVIVLPYDSSKNNTYQSFELRFREE